MAVLAGGRGVACGDQAREGQPQTGTFTAGLHNGAAQDGCGKPCAIVSHREADATLGLAR